MPELPLACPLDQSPLRCDDRGCVCEAGHRFDRARHGYLNLLPVQHKPSRDPGDTRTMVAARRRVLEAGLFAQLAEDLCDLVAARLENADHAEDLIVDAGCGDGYYTHALQQSFKQRQEPDTSLERQRVLGTDISKWAIQSAARGHRDMTWAVANNTHLPVLPGRARLITSIFGFPTWQPWGRLQHSGQWVVVVDAGRQHLSQLRERVYPKVDYHDAPAHPEHVSAGYELISSSTSLAHVHVRDSQRLIDLLDMTPHGHRISATARDALASSAPPIVTVEACLRAYRRVRA